MSDVLIVIGDGKVFVCNGAHTEQLQACAVPSDWPKDLPYQAPIAVPTE